MKKSAVLIFGAIVLTGCGSTGQQTANTDNPAVNNNSLLVRSSSGDAAANSAPVAAPGAKTKWTQSGNPIDTGKFDAEIQKAEKAVKAKPSDAGAKKALAEAYVERGFALTEARQYASALGDYRKAIKLDPANQEARKWIDEIVKIYNSLNKEYPKEGEEPPPLPFQKDAK